MRKTKWLIISIFLIVALVVVVGVIDKQTAETQSEKARENRVESLVSAINKDDSDYNSKKELAFTYFMNRQYQEAIDLLTDIVEVKKADTEALHLLVVSYMQTDQIDKAETTSSRLLEFNNYNEVGLLNHAQIMFLQGDSNGFEELIEKSVEASEINELEGFEAEFFEKLLSHLQTYKNHLSNGEDYAAFEFFANQQYFEPIFRLEVANKATQIDNPSAELLELKGKLEIRLNKMTEALTSFETLTQNYPNYEYGHMLHGQTAFLLNDEKSLSKLKKNIPSSLKESSRYVNILESFNTDKSKAISKLEEIAEATEQYKSLYYYTLYAMSSKAEMSEKEEQYWGLFSTTEGDVEYYMSLVERKEV